MFLSCKRTLLPPTAICETFPCNGDTTIWFEIDAGKSLNNQGYHYGLQYRWDYETDGVWDTDWKTESVTSHQYINPGTYKIIVQVADFEGNSDTVSVTIKTYGQNQDISTLIDPRDGKSYGIAKFRGYWWMKENLVYGKVLNLNQPQTDNGVVEQYYGFYLGDLDTIFGIYDWREAMNYNFKNPQGICPPGWHIPSVSEWKILLEGFPDNYSIEFYGKEGLSGLNLQTGTYLSTSRPEVDYTLWPGNNRIWASDYKLIDYQNIYIGTFLLTQDGKDSRNQIWVGNRLHSEIFNNLSLIHGQSIRCIKEVK